MSFRIEKKYLIESNQVFEAKKWILNNNFNKLYPARIIESIYFENSYNDMFLSSEEGCTPRKKIRIRYYPDKTKIKKYYLEIKTSSAEGRFKKIEKINSHIFLKLLKIGYMDPIYGLCKSKLKVNFYRNYYICNNYRITMDKNITYSHIYNSLIKSEDKFNILEIKTTFDHPQDFLNKVPFQEIRFSKYCRGFKLLN